MVQLRSESVGNLRCIVLLACRFLQLCAAADDDDDSELAHMFRTASAHLELRKVPGLLVALQGPPAEPHRAPQKCEYIPVWRRSWCKFGFVVVCYQYFNISIY